MKLNTLALLCLTALTGCTSKEWAGTAQIGADPSSSAQGGIAIGSLRMTTPSIADAADTGQLMRYERNAPKISTRAYTLYPVSLSERHAISSIIGGDLDLAAPDGTPLKIRYDHHTESPDGNWTWVGRVEGGDQGQEAIITFGEKAVYGTIPQTDGSRLNLTTRGGQVYVMQVNADYYKAARAQSGRDTLAAPASAALTSADRAFVTAASNAALKTAASANTAGATAGAVTTIDLAAGYTNGFASMAGSQSAAATRIAYLVSIANQALTNSKIPGAIRLVSTTQVIYPDNTDNGDALRALTGRTDSGSTRPVPASLQPLLAARDTYGADLVALVRRFDYATNNGCGIAWLNGADGVDIVPSQDDDYGFSVVSDGEDQGDDNNVYYCEDHSLAHEMAHNMGSAHDVDNSNGQGRYPYSYGLKTSITGGNFYTVMAYGDSGQTSYNVFSNPDINTCGGNACGVANQSDNARTLRQTMPIIARFRATVVATSQAAVSDFNGDGVSDLVWRNRSSGANIIWRAADSTVRHPFASVPNTSWIIAATADFDGDGAADVLWRNLSTGANTIWRSANSAAPLAVTPITDLSWVVAGAGDFDGDGRADILWRNVSTGANTVWKSGNSNTRVALAAVPGATWIVAGIGDFDGSGTADIVWRNRSTGANRIWNGGDANSRGAVANVPNLDWFIAGVGDFNRDGRSDILWRQGRTGENVIWLSGISTASRPVTRVADSSWRVVKIGDFDGDGAADIVWRHLSSGGTSLWKGGVSGAEQPITDVADTTWQIVP